ncbi:MAG: YbaK/EbsC family protein [Treponema sp.]|nr:YbaK/EbsC family protein [Treponema sp.]
MSVEKVKAYFDQFGLRDKIIELDESSATVELAAKALHTEGARIAKTLSFMVGDKAILIVTAGDTKIDNAKYRHKFGCKARMLTAEELDRLVGHAPGGVCPFAVPSDVKIYLDESLKRFQTVFPAAGSSNSAIELTIPDLEKYSAFTEWTDVSKLKEAAQ